MSDKPAVLLRAFRPPALHLLLLIAAVTAGTFLFTWTAYVVYAQSFPISFFRIWKHWDTFHFLYVAANGYRPEDSDKISMVIFPLYPLLIRGAGFLFRGDLLASALTVSNLAYAGAAVCFYKLARLDQDEESALRAVFYFSIWPTAYFLHAGYAESLFLLLTIASFYCARKGLWLAAGLAGMLASGTRVLGIAVLPALLIEYLASKNFQIKKIRPDILWLGLVPLGILVYMYICRQVSGNAFLFLDLQRKYWFKFLGFPWQGLHRSWLAIPNRIPEEQIMVCWMEILFGIIGFLASIYVLFRVRLSYGIYMLLCWLLATCTLFWLSVPRYTLMLFPLFIPLAEAGKRPGIHSAVSFSSILFYALFASMFVLSKWAF